MLVRRARQFDVVARYLPFPLSDLASLLGYGDEIRVLDEADLAARLGAASRTRLA